MDWAKAIERHRQSLLRIVAALFAMVGLGQGGTVERLSWPVYRAVLRVLGSAEAAVRRLIIVAARDIVVKPRATRPAPAGLKIAIKGKGRGRVSFQLFDPRERFDRDYGRHTKNLRAGPLCRRLAPIEGALEDLASQAGRYAHWRAKPLEQRRPKLASPLRPGPPPGHRKTPIHKVDGILSECHWLVRSVPAPDTS